MSEEVLTAIRKILAPIERRVKAAVGRAIITAINDGAPLQQLQMTVMADEIVDGADRVQHYGFTSVPQAGAEGVVVFIGGDRGHGVVIAVDDRRFRLTGLQNGEVALYTDEGDKIHFKRGHIIDIETQNLTITATRQVTITSPLVAVSGNVTAGGDVSDQTGGSGGSSMRNMRVIFDEHTHADPQGGVSAVPMPQM